MSTKGTGSSSQTGHSDNGQKCADFTLTSDNGYSGLTHSNLEKCRHLRDHYTSTCIFCGSEFTDRHQLRHHVITMHSGRQFVCPQCQRSYAYKNGLNEHVKKMHNKVYRYQCETCDRGFTVRSRYYDHVVAHTGVKRYTCSICKMKFTNKYTLKAHVLRLHPNETAHIC